MEMTADDPAQWLSRFFERCKDNVNVRPIGTVLTGAAAHHVKAALSPAAANLGSEATLTHLVDSIKDLPLEDFTAKILAYMDSVISKLQYEPQVFRLTAPPIGVYDVSTLTRLVADAHIKEGVPVCVDSALAQQVESTNTGEGYEFFVQSDSQRDGGKCFQTLVSAMAEHSQAVCLNMRIIPDSVLGGEFVRLAKSYEMYAKVCPSSHGWSFGPSGIAASTTGLEDNRGYLITATSGALTPTHVDMGVQSVLYVTTHGTNTILGVPSMVAAALHVVKGAVYEWPDQQLTRHVCANNQETTKSPQFICPCGSRQQCCKSAWRTGFSSMGSLSRDRHCSFCLGVDMQ